jgi:hypothetical protein
MIYKISNKIIFIKLIMFIREVINFSIKIADFGESKIFEDENDEYCIRSRGTNVFKSPEMLINYGFQNNNNYKKRDNYDRRKKEGTTRSSDIWSLGCLFYELLTGNFLFPEIDDDYFGFTAKLNTSNFSEIFTQEKKSLINNNIYLIDFLKFVMINDQKYRPNIDKVIERYDHVHAILSNLNISKNPCINTLPKRNSNDIKYSIEKNILTKSLNFSYPVSIPFSLNSNFNSDSKDSFSFNSFEQVLENMQELLMQKWSLSSSSKTQIHIKEKDEKNRINKNKNNDINENDNNDTNIYNTSKEMNIHKSQFQPGIYKIMKDVYFCDFNFFENEYENNNNSNIFSNIGITHIISWRKSNNKKLSEKIEFLNIFENINDTKKNLFFHIFKIMDYIRYCITHRGILCFIDDFHYRNFPDKQNNLMRNIIILCFSYLLKLQAYDISTYLNSKLLFYVIDISDMINISKWINSQNYLEKLLINIPTFKCICGACNIYLKPDFDYSQINSYSNPKSISNSNINSKINNCNCSKKYENIDNTECPSNGCYDYIQDMKVKK